MAGIKWQEKEEQEGEARKRKRSKKGRRRGGRDEGSGTPQKVDLFIENRFLKHFGPAGTFKGRRVTLERNRAQSRGEA
jgi:hypothetical protein